MTVAIDAHRLREVRQSRGLTLRALAELVGVSHVWLLKLEQGENRPSAELLERIEHALECRFPAKCGECGTPLRVEDALEEHEPLVAAVRAILRDPPAGGTYDELAHPLVKRALARAR